MQHYADAKSNTINAILRNSGAGPTTSRRPRSDRRDVATDGR